MFDYKIRIKLKLMRLLLIILLTLSSSLAFAQKQNNQWRFGRGVGINFNTNPPSNSAGSEISTPEGSASVADRNTGELLFYTDGIKVWNANNQIMPNGTGLLGGTSSLLSSTTAALIVPKPESSNLYYIFTIDEQASNNGVRYSLVDMSLDNGLGDVVAGQKNKLLYRTTSEKLELVPTADKLGYWLITHDDLGNSFFAFKITVAGIQSSPVVSSVGATQVNGAGHMKVNRQFNKLAIGVTFGASLELFDFDNATGKISNPITWKHQLSSSPLIYGIEFSPNGKLLYVTNLEKLVQFDLSSNSASNIQNSYYELPTGAFSVPASVQLASDHKIYVNTGSFDVINCPDKLGDLCGYQKNAVPDQTGGGGYGLPKWIYYTNDLPLTSSNGIVYSDTCIGNSTQFTLQNLTDISSVTWDFGEPSSGTNNSAVGSKVNHTYSSTGNYTVRAILSNTCGFDTLFLNNLGIVDCNNPSPKITGIKLIGDTCSLPANISFQAVGTSSSAYFFWSFDDARSGTKDTVTITGASPIPFPTHTFAAAGSYNICVTYKEPGFPDKTICRRISIGLCCDGAIASIDSCLNDSIAFSILTGSTVTSIKLDFDDLTSSENNSSTLSNPKHLFSKPGQYKVSAIVNFSCGIDTLYKSLIITDCKSDTVVCQLFVPNVFTPNADSTNDKFYPICNCPFEQYELSVFNRWGELIFNTTNPNDKWDGSFKGIECADGVYFYIITYKFPTKQAKSLYGTTTLLR